MPFSMKVNKEAVQGKDAIPQGIYEFRFTGFKPKKNKAGDSANLNAEFEIINNPEFAGSKVYDALSYKAAWSFPAFANALGMDMETDGTDYWLPGEFDGDKAKFKEDDPSTWVYRGPLLNRTGKFEVNVRDYNGKNQNGIERYFVQDGFTPRPM